MESAHHHEERNSEPLHSAEEEQQYDHEQALYESDMMAKAAEGVEEADMHVQEVADAEQAATEEHAAEAPLGQLDLMSVGLEDLSPEEQTAALYRLASFTTELQGHNARLQERSSLLQHLLIQYEEERLQHENTVKELTSELTSMQDMSAQLSAQCKQLQDDKGRLENRVETYEQSGSEQVQKMWRQVDLLEKQLKASREETSVADKQFKAMTEHCRKLEGMLRARGVYIPDAITAADDLDITAAPLATAASASSASSGGPSTPPAPSPAPGGSFSEEDEASTAAPAPEVPVVEEVPTPVRRPQRQASITPRYKATPPASLLQRTTSASPRGPPFSPAGRNLSKSMASISLPSPKAIPSAVPRSQSNADASKAIAAARRMRAGLVAANTSLTTSDSIKECDLSEINIKRWPHVPDMRASFKKKGSELPPWRI